MEGIMARTEPNRSNRAEMEVDHDLVLVDEFDALYGGQKPFSLP